MRWDWRRSDPGRVAATCEAHNKTWICLCLYFKRRDTTWLRVAWLDSIPVPPGGAGQGQTDLVVRGSPVWVPVVRRNTWF